MKYLHQVHVLPTDKGHGIPLERMIQLFKELGISEIKDTTPNKLSHIYFTSDEEIKDWMLQPEHNSVQDFRKMPKSTAAIAYEKNGWRKIVATTNPELWTVKRREIVENPKTGEASDVVLYSSEGVAKIPLQFIKEYVEKPVKEVNLEVDTCPIDSNGNIIGTNMPYPYEALVANHTIKYSLKLDSNGCVIVSPVKHTWDTLWTNWCNWRETHSVKYIGQFLEWMKENYHNPIPKSVSPIEEKMYTRSKIREDIYPLWRVANFDGYGSNTDLADKAFNKWFDKNYPK